MRSWKNIQPCNYLKRDNTICGESSYTGTCKKHRNRAILTYCMKCGINPCRSACGCCSHCSFQQQSHYLKKRRDEINVYAYMRTMFDDDDGAIVRRLPISRIREETANYRYIQKLFTI